MGAIARNIANKITTSGVFTSGAITNSSVTGITVLANASDGITLISSQTASNSASISFTSGLTSTYKVYKFVFVNIHPQNDEVQFRINFTTDGTNFNVTKTTTVFHAYHAEDGSQSSLSYSSTRDLAQSTADHVIVGAGSALGNANDDSCSGEVILFNPSSTTYVKHFMSKAFASSGEPTPFPFVNYTAGYGNTTSAITGVKFVMDSGNIDAGTIYLYGIK
jgi:hypothetical protein